MIARITSCRVAVALLFAVTANGTLPAAITYAASDSSKAAHARRDEKRQNQGVINGNKYGQTKHEETITQETPDVSETTTDVATDPQQPEKQNDSASKQQSNVVIATQKNTEKRNPSGNNGFIKVNEETTPDNIPNNDPHVGCSFKVEFYNYDKNPDYRAKVNFALHSPTKGEGYSMNVNGNLNPFIGEDYAGGGNDLDAVEEYKLTFTGKPHPKQGYHVKLTIQADGSRGADVKHKVFWVQPCQEAAPATATATTEGSVQGVSTDQPQQAVSKNLPARLPSTGTGMLGIYTALLASAAAYVGVLRLQKNRINSEQ